MNRPKIELRVRKEHEENSNKLTFTLQAQEAARTRMQQEQERRKHIPIKVVPLKHTFPQSTIYEKLFGDEATEATTVVPQMDKQSQSPSVQQVSQMDIRHGELPHRESTPHKQQHDDVHAYRHRSTYDDPYVDLGPIYEEQMDEGSQKKGNRRKVLHSVQLPKPERVIEHSGQPPRVKGRLKFSLAVMGAIALGTLMGYFLLLFAVGGNDFHRPISTQPVPSTSNESSVPSPAAELSVAKGGKATVGKLAIADRTFYAIQAGVFTDIDTAENAEKGLRQRDAATLLFNDDVHRLFIGIAYMEQDTAMLSKAYKALGKELYLKKYTVKGGAVAIAGATVEQMETLNKFITHGTYLLEKTALWSASVLAGEAAISADEWQKFRETHTAFLLEEQEVTTFLPAGYVQWTTKMKEALDRGIVQMVAYVESGDREKLIASQQGLLDYFDHYRQFLKGAGIDVVVR